MKLKLGYLKNIFGIPVFYSYIFKGGKCTKTDLLKNDTEQFLIQNSQIFQTVL